MSCVERVWRTAVWWVLAGWMGREGESRTLGVQTCFYGIFVVGLRGVFECFAEALGCYVFCLREFLHLCRFVCA